MTAKKTKPSTKGKKKPAAATNSKEPQDVAEQRYRSFKLEKRIKHPGAKITGSFRLLWESMVLLRREWKVLGGIVLIYALLNVFLVRGLGSGLDVAELKDVFQYSELDRLSSGLAILTLLIGTNTNAEDPATSTYQSTIVILTSLAVIWALRQLQARKRIGIRDAFYKGIYPLIPFVLIIFVIGLQLLPLVIGSGMYASVTAEQSVVTGFEIAIAAVIFFLLALLSLYMVCSSVFALYIVTLPDMTPLKALRSARLLVKHRRFSVLRKLLFLPLAWIVLSALLILPLIWFAAPFAEPVYFAFSALSLALVHSYLYLLYRELL